MISYDEFSKVEMKVGRILSVEPVPKSEKLLKLSVDFGVLPKAISTITLDTTIEQNTELQPEVRDVRQILSGIAKYFPLGTGLVGKKCMFVTNLVPRPLMGMESNGMILAVSTEDGKLSLLEPDPIIPEGTKAR